MDGSGLAILQKKGFEERLGVRGVSLVFVPWILTVIGSCFVGGDIIRCIPPPTGMFRHHQHSLFFDKQRSSSYCFASSFIAIGVGFRLTNVDLW